MYNEMAISISQLNKMFKLYKHPRDRVLDLLGLGSLIKKQHQEFWALKDIHLNIKKGSKIALIGRNGAGKSTLLKIIAGSLQPTSGDIHVNGKVSALMELGTGFHPEFSGKENIFASLAYQGVVGKEAKLKYEEIVDFSELEEFIDKPVKTYSAGMYARLAFAVSTAIIPEILIIDEILGAGDAYFINKSIDRMKRLTEGGTTVLFVSHDITSVQKMCTEAIWIDKGRVVMEGNILDVSAEYLASIRRQEEKRLKSRNIRLKHNNFKSLEETSTSKLTYCHLITEAGSPKDQHPISEVKLWQGENLIDHLRIGDAGDINSDFDLFIIVDKETINWSEPKEDRGILYRNFEDLGGEYQHALVAFKIPIEDKLSDYELEITYQDISDEVVKVEYFDGESYCWMGNFEARNDKEWKTSTYQFIENAEIEEENIPEQSVNYQELMDEREGNNRIYGSGEAVITSVQFLDDQGQEKLVFTNLEYKKIRIHYFANQRIKNPIFVVAYYLLDGTCATQLISSKDEFELREIEGEGSVEIVFDPLLLGKGSYLISVAIFKELNILDNVEPSAYDLHDKLYEIKIEQPFGINVDLGIVNHPVRWGVKHGTR